MAVVGPATVRVAVTVLELGRGGRLEVEVTVTTDDVGTVTTDEEGTTTTVEVEREVDVDVLGGGEIVEELLWIIGMGLLVAVLVAVLTIEVEVICAQ